MIRINGQVIEEGAILREMQFHPAPSATAARQRAAVALALRELLLQEAARLGIGADDPTDGGAALSGEERRIRQLLEREVRCPRPTEAECRRWYENNREKLREPAHYHVSHILRLSPPEDWVGRERERRRCQRLLRILVKAPDRFATLARKHSRCRSAQGGGDLGLIGPGQTCPEFERALERAPIGEVAPEPVATRYGWHVVLLHERRPGRLLEFEEAGQRIAEYLVEAVWRRAVSQYLRILAGRATIEGIDLDAAASPLVQ